MQTHAIGVDKWHRRLLPWPADQVVERKNAAALNQYVERGDGPHQRIFEAKLVPKVLADLPAFDVSDQQKQQDGRSDRACEQPEDEQGASDKLRQRDRPRPKFSGPITALIELDGEVFQVERAHARIGEE